VGTNQRASIVMTEAEIAEFLTNSRTATMGTIGLSGLPHLVAMWYAVVDGQLWFETKAKSQKAVNLRRDDRITVLVEDGHTYDQLRGVSLEGRGILLDDPDTALKVGISVWERYYGPYTDDQRPSVEALMNKRVVVRVDVERTRSWDHRKLGLPAMPVAGSTAEHLG
jgi:PPOX class probable F420-dependent enzyme